MPMSKIWIVVPLMLVASAQAHVTLPPGGATAGSVYSASFRVGHACKGAASTTSIGASRISRTRDHDTLAVARLAYKPIKACAGANTRI